MDDRRLKILLATERLVAHYGITKTTISDIAREAQIGVGTVYLEFHSKDEIVSKLAAERHARVLQAMREAADHPQPFEHRFRAMMDARVRTFIEVAGDGAHAADLIHCGCDAVQQQFESFKNEQRHVVAEFLRGAAMAGAFAIRDPEQTATAILRAYATFTPPALYHQTFNNLFAELEWMHEVVLGGIKAR